MELTSLASVKGALRIPAAVTLWDARITEIGNEVESDLLTTAGLTAWASTTAYSATLDPWPGSRSIVLPRHPVTGVAALTVDGGGFVSGTDYWLDTDSDSIRAIPDGGFFVGSRQSIAVTYTAGWIVAGATPSWLARLATLSAARQFYLEETAGLGSLSVQPVTKTAPQTFDADRVYVEIERMLGRLHRPLG